MQLERRVAFRRAMKKAVQTAHASSAPRASASPCSGRLGGAEIARYEWYREGRVPLHTLRADIDYGFAEAKTTYGVIGVQGLDLPRRGAAPVATREPRSRRAAGAPSRRRRGHVEETDMLQPAQNEVPEDDEGPHARARPTAARSSPAATSACRRPSAAGSRPPDRGRPRRDHPPHQARRQALDPRLPGQAAHQEARRDPHGQGQGRPGVLGRRRSSRAACCSRWRASTDDVAEKAFHARRPQAVGRHPGRAARRHAVGGRHGHR